jgi:uncharacterized integral membrane protein
VLLLSVRDDGRVPATAFDMLGPIAELGSFQRRRVRRTASVLAAVALLCIVLILVSMFTQGVEVTFGAETPVRLPILALLAAVLMAPIVWSAVFRSRRYGLTLTRDALIVVSWWRTRTFERGELSAAEALPGVMRMSDGFFSGQGTDAAPFAVWLSPSNPERRRFPLGVTTGTREATALASRKINAWLAVEPTST